MAVIDELVTLLGLETDPRAEGEAKSFNELVGSVRTTALAAGTALVALSAASFAMAKSFAESADESGKFAKSVDISLKKLEELEFVSQRLGGSSDELRSDLAALADQFGSAERGIDMLIGRFSGLSDQQARMAGKTFGLSESTIRILQAGSGAVSDLREEFRKLGGGLPDGAVERAAEFNDQWVNLTTTIQGIAGVVQVALLPAMTGTVQTLREFLVSNRELIASGLSQFLEGVQKGFAQFNEVVDRVVQVILPLVSGLGDMTEGLDSVDIIANLVAGTLVALAVLLAPLALQLAAVSAAAVVVGIAFDDLITFIKGGDSVIGRFFDAFEKRFPALADLIKSTANAFKDLFSFLIEGWRMVGEAISDILPDIGALTEGVLDLLDSGAGLLGFGDPSTASAASPSVQVPASVVSNTSNNSTGGSVTNTFNINGAGDPRGVAAEVARRGGLGSAGQILSPGPRAPRVG